MWAQEDIFRVEQIHMRCRSARTREPRAAGAQHRDVAQGVALESAVIDHIGVHELQRHKTSHAAAILADALDRLQRFPIVPEIDVVGDEQVGAISLTSLPQPCAVHHGLHRSGTRRQAVGRERLDLIFPEAPDGRIDTAGDAAVIDVGDKQLQTADLLAAIRRTIAIAIVRQIVLHRALGIGDPRFQQIDHFFFAGVLKHFEAADAYRSRRLRDGVLSGGKDIGRTDVEDVIEYVIANLFMIRFYMLPCSPDYLIISVSRDVGRSWAAYCWDAPPSR